MRQKKSGARVKTQNTVTQSAHKPPRRQTSGELSSKRFVHVYGEESDRYEEMLGLENGISLILSLLFCSVPKPIHLTSPLSLALYLWFYSETFYTSFQLFLWSVETTRSKLIICSLLFKFPSSHSTLSSVTLLYHLFWYSPGKMVC